MKVVINDDFGGFSLSYEGMLRYALIKGVELYPEGDEYGTHDYWTVPKDRRPKVLAQDMWHTMTLEERAAHNKSWADATLSERDMSRDDPALVQTVEELGQAAGGRFSHLKVVEIPDDVKWCIEEYDGREWVAEVHRTWS